MRRLAFIGVLAIIIAVAAAIYFFGGYYSVAASAEEPKVVSWALVKVRMASVDRQSAGLTPQVALEDQGVIQAGARAFATRGCVNCHGAPGVEWAKFSEGLRPDPPDLKEIVNDREPRHLFWVIKNGINMTGMPSFGAINVDDKEIWSIVAFLKKLPTVTPETFKAWTTPGAPQ
jgi:mono/diheme cytochrome c family protein